MKIEIVEFYPDPKKDSPHQRKGTFHIYVYDVGEYPFDLRGIYAEENKNRTRTPMVRFPKMFAIEDGERVRYPAFHFSDEKPSKMIIDLCKKECLKYFQQLRRKK